MGKRKNNRIEEEQRTVELMIRLYCPPAATRKATGLYVRSAVKCWIIPVHVYHGVPSRKISVRAVFAPYIATVRT